MAFFMLAAAVIIIAFNAMMHFNKLWYEPRFKSGRAPLPPGSLGWPIFGNMAAFLRAFKSQNPDSFINEYLVRYKRIGLYKAFLFWQPTILATTPEACRLVLTKDTLFETGWPSSARQLVGERSFAGITGKEHLTLRKLTEPHLNSPKALENYILPIETNLRDTLQCWSEKGKIIFLEELRKFAFRTIHDILFGEQSSLQVEEMSALYYSINQGIRALPINFPGTAFNKALKAHKKMVQVVGKVIYERRQCSAKTMDTLALLMNEKDKHGKHLSDEQIIDLLIMYMNAGHDSTAHLMLWLIILLQRHPLVYQQVKAEQEEVAIRKGTREFLTLADVKSMTYLSRTIDETLRLVNISPMVFRKALVDVEFNGFTIPKDWNVQCWMRQVHLDPTIHHNPFQFDPERVIKYGDRPFTFIPFGMGSRTCPGNELAKMQTGILIHHLILHYQWEPVNMDAKTIFLPHPRPTDLYTVHFRKKA